MASLLSSSGLLIFLATLGPLCHAQMSLSADLPNCQYANNPLGTCTGCEGQFFIDETCTEGFYCSDDIPDPLLFEGCLQKCASGEQLRPNFANTTWECVPESEGWTCPGKFNVNCPEDDIGQDFNGTMCECEQQLFVSADCKEAFYCA